jgi:hypothetical protein
VIVYAEESRNSLVRSRLNRDRRAIGEVEGSTRSPGSASCDGGLPQDGARSVDLAVFGYESPNLRVPAPPAPGLGYADRTLETDGVEVGDTIVVGPARVPVEIVGWVEDTRLLFQAGLWVEPGTWHRILETSRPDATLPEGTFQAALVGTDADPDSVAAAIEREVPGRARSRSPRRSRPCRGSRPSRRPSCRSSP